MIVSDTLFCIIMYHIIVLINYIVKYIVYISGNNHFIQIEPNCKKFKRRNHSIYSNTL